MASRKSVGRPRQQPEAGERVQLSFRVTPELKRRLDAAADQSGRSQSQEAEFRLERSFDHQDLLSEALTLAYGRKLAGIIMALGFVMDGAARSRRMPLDPSDKDWTQDSEAFERAFQAASTFLTAARPQGTPPKPTSSDLGWAFTNDFMEAMRGHKPDYPAMEHAANIKHLIGPMAERMSPTRIPLPAQPSSTMAPRSNWQGYLKLVFVSTPIAIYPATSSDEEVGFSTLGRATSNRQVEEPLYLKLRDALAERIAHGEWKPGTAIPNESELAREYGVSSATMRKALDMMEGEHLLTRRQGRGTFVNSQFAIEGTRIVDIEKFVAKSSIDDRYRGTPYYLAPTGLVDQEAFAVIRDAMKEKKGRVAIARVVMPHHKRILMLEPFGEGMLGTLLRHPYEIRSEEAIFQEIPDIKVPNEMMALAEHVINRMTGAFEPEKIFHGKQAGLPAPQEATAGPTNVINLLDALRRSA